MKLKLSLLAGLLFSLATAFSQDTNFWVFLCFGQSNMEGGGRIEEKDRTVDPRFQVLADFDVTNRNWRKGEWYDAVPPLTRRTRGFSMVDAFGRMMVSNLPPHIKVGVVKVGAAGTRIEFWDKDNYQAYLASLPASDAYKMDLAKEYGGNPYGYFVGLAKTAQKSGVIKGILVHQGESNFEDPDWPKKVKTVYDHLMGDLGLDPQTVPLLAGEVVNADQGGTKASANVIMKNLPGTLPNSYVISSAGLPCNPDHLHFTGEGYRQFGQRYAGKMLSVLGIPVEPAGGTPEAPAAK